MKIRVLKDCTALDAWKRRPRGYVVLKVPPTVKVESVATGVRIDLVHISPNVERAFRQVEKIREKYDTDPCGMKPCVVLVPRAIAESERVEQFMARASMIVGV